MATIKYQIGNTVYSCLNVGDVTGRYIAIQAPVGGGAGWGSPEIIPLFSGGSGSVVEHGGYKYTLGHLCVDGLRPAISRVRASIATFNIRYCINYTDESYSKQRNYGFNISTISGETPTSVQLCLIGGNIVYMTFPADGKEHWFKYIWKESDGTFGHGSPFTLVFNFSGKSVMVHFGAGGNKPFTFTPFEQDDLDCVQHMHHSYYMMLEVTETGGNALSFSYD